MTDNRVAGLIPAAGAGTRLGLGHKAFVEVGGLTLLARAVASLSPIVDEVIVACPDGCRGEVPGAHVIAGGGTRQESVRRLLGATKADWVLIHDAARPFLPSPVARAVLAAAREVGAATAALPLADTLVRAEGLTWTEGLPREKMWAVQTPQGFARSVLLSAHEKARVSSWAATDDAGLVARSGGEVRLVPGDARLFKVTGPGDLALARALAPSLDRNGWDRDRDG